MQITIGWMLLLLGGFLYFAQFISSVNFKLAQRIGIQEDPEETDSILQTAERFTAYWDLLTLCWLPLAGLLMVIDHDWWPIVALVGGSIYFDTSGREAAKIISLRKEGFRLGSKNQQRVFFGSYIVMALIGLFLIGYSIRTYLKIALVGQRWLQAVQSRESSRRNIPIEPGDDVATESRQKIAQPSIVVRNGEGDGRPAFSV